MAHLLKLAGWRRMLVTGLCLAGWRALQDIPLPLPQLNWGLVLFQLHSLDTASSPLHALASALPLARYSVVALGIAPYVGALIVISLLEAISGQVRAIGSTARGRIRLRRWTRALAAALAIGSAYGFTIRMQFEQALPSQVDWSARLVLCLELSAGTMVLILIADVMDELGLSFGNGAILIYALQPMALDVHRLAALVAYAPSVEHLYLPFLIWAGFSIAVVAIAVSALLAVRRIPSPADVKNDKKGRPPRPVELRLLMSGVLRPTLFAQAVLSLPVTLSGYVAQSNPSAASWITAFWTAFGPNPWGDLAYVVAKAGLVIGFTYFVVVADLRGMPIGAHVVSHVRSLVLIGGALLALIVVVIPEVEWVAVRATGTVIFVSGTDAVLVVALIVGIVRALERRRPRGVETLVSARSLP